MSATSTGDVVCPVCEEYEGPRPSVEAHISSSAGAHEGHVGQQFRGEFEEQLESSVEFGGQLESESGGGASTPLEIGQEQQELQETGEGPDESGSLEVEVESRESTEPAESAATSGVLAAAAVPGALLFGDDSSEGVDTAALLAGVAVVVVVVWLLVGDSSGDSSAPAGEGSGSGEGSASASEDVTGVI